VTTTEPDAGDQRRGRHAKSEDADRTADLGGDDREPAHAATDERDEPADDEREENPVPETREPEARERRPGLRSHRHAIAHHPAGSSLLTAAGLVTGLALVPLLFDRLHFEVATRAAAAARSAAAPWPAGGEPWFWPGWLAMLATVVAVVVLVLAALGVRLPDLAVLVTAVVLAVPTARAAWATIDVLNAHLWELVPACVVCLVAFGSAVAAAFRWRSGEGTATGAGTSEVAGVTLGAWLLVVLVFLGGSAIASSAQTHAAGFVTSSPQDVAGLLSVRAADAPRLHDLRGSWVPQLAAAKVGDDAAATAYALVHHDVSARYPTVLARGDDVGASDLDSSWWLSLAVVAFDSPDAAAGWCNASGIVGCTARQVG
jgi:hypothetical protein